MASLVQAYVDKENGPAAGSRKNRIASHGARPSSGKTFGGEQPQTPRQVLGNISNDSTIRKGSHGKLLQGKPPMKKPDPLKPFKQPNLLRKPGGLSMRKPSTGNTPRQPLMQKKMPSTVTPSLFRLPSKLLSDNLPPVEQMHIFEDKFDGMNGLPAEHCLSAHLGRFRPLMPPVSRWSTGPEAPPFDPSSLTFEVAMRPLFQEEDITLPELPSCLDMPPIETIDFLDINKIKLWEDEV